MNRQHSDVTFHYDTVGRDVGPVTRFRYNPETGSYQERPHAKFIWGPIPLDWMARANALPGKAGAVGLALWYVRDVRKSLTVLVTREAMALAACHRQALYSALDSLEAAGLIEQERRPGKRTLVTLLTGQ